MIFETVADGGCKSYIVGCEETCTGAIVDPTLNQLDRYQGIANREGLKIRTIFETHTHADHFSAAAHLAAHFDAQVVMHRDSPAPHVDIQVEDGHMIPVGRLKFQVMHTPGHTWDSVCYYVEDRVFTCLLYTSDAADE